MSDTVKQIREGLETLIETTLPTWKELENKYSLEKNNFINQSKRFGVTTLGGTNTNSIIGYYSVARIFEVTFCNKYISTLNTDANPENAMDEIEDAMDEVIKAAVNSTLGLGGNVISGIIFDDIDDPDLETLENVAINKLRFIINYRAQVTGC